jgi:uncharacterized phage protein gp47/JayE
MNVIPTIDASGIAIPTYEEVWTALVNTYKSIYGEDIYIDPDSQDGQWIGILALAFHDCNQAAVSVFRSFSPTYAIGENLSSLIKLNGLKRHVATASTAIGSVVGVAGTTITNGAVKDASGNLWSLPASVVIPPAGEITVTVTAQEIGAIEATIGSIDTIATPEFGWQSFTNTTTATLGAPIESDSDVRQRQTLSVTQAALTIKESIYSAIGNLSNVTRWDVHENDTNLTDSDGVPPHTIAVVVEGGDATDILTIINNKKAPGIQTFGTVVQTIEDTGGHGIKTTVKYQPLTRIQIYYAITIVASEGYVSTTGSDLIEAIIAYTNTLKIGADVHQFQVAAAASQISLLEGSTYYITVFNLGLSPTPTASALINIGYDEAAYTTADNISLTVL